MSSLSSSSSSPSVYGIPIVTTTVFSPSATSHVQPADNDDGVTIPIGSIVGGCLAGIILAVAAVVGWHLWGKSIKRKEEAKRREAVRPSFTLSSLIPAHLLPSTSDITPCHGEEHETERVRIPSILIHPLLPGTQPGSQSQVCRAGTKHSVRQGQPITHSLSHLSPYTAKPPLPIGGHC